MVGSIPTLATCTLKTEQGVNEMDKKQLSRIMRMALEKAGFSFDRLDECKFEVAVGSGRNVLVEVYEDNGVDLVAYRVSGAVPGQVTQHLSKVVQIIQNAM